MWALEVKDSEPSLASKYSPQAQGWLHDTGKGAAMTGDSQGSQYTQSDYNRTFTNNLTKAIPDLLVIHHIHLSQKGKLFGDKSWTEAFVEGLRGTKSKNMGEK